MGNNSSSPSQIISLPKGGGALQGIGEKFSPDLHTGTGNFTVPIALPPGRNGFQPQLSLAYSTGNGNGPFGLGWSLSVPGVSRKTSKGIPIYNDAKDVFVLSGVEDLVPVPGAAAGNQRYRPRTEGLFALIDHVRENDNNFWRVRSKDGLVSFYGTERSKEATAAWEDSAIIAKPTDRRRVFAWKLKETRDPFGNRIVYEYERDKAREGSHDWDPQDGPHNWDQLYLKRICYVNYGLAGDQKKFLISVSFNYQERTGDPFSDYRAGFEIRTRKRCSSIEIRTHAGKERLTQVYHLIYLDQRSDIADLESVLPLNRVALLSQIRVVGHNDDDPDAAKRTQELPPLEFHYSRFEPEKRDFFPLGGRDLPTASLAHSDYELVDLFGNGLPDILEMNGVARYWRNLGDGSFDLPRPMQDAPAGLMLADSGVQLIDADGDGRTDLLVTKNGLSGYFPLRFGGYWDRRSFKKYETAPSFNLEDPEVKLVDLNGDGVTDAIRSGTRLECFFNDPTEGWTETKWVERQSIDVFPNVNFSDARVRWADMAGDGQQDIVLVYDGNIEYYPNLGWGNWGKPIHMEHSPHFPYGYNPKRILVGDVDGDGLADIIYVDDNKVTLWINRSGNAWSDPVEILGTPRVSDMDSVRLTDMLATGISGVLWSADFNGLSRRNMFFLDFTGGVKPYLLNEMDNHIGAVTKVEYAPSTRFYVKDEKELETCWKTPLPFPVRVVSKVEVIDHFSEGKLTTEYRYHHGYWDGGEREFRGFGMVEQLDTETFETYNEAGLHGAETAFVRLKDRKNFSPPTLTKTWFHQGPVGDEFGAWEELDWSSEYWPGDPPLLKHTETVNEFLQSWDQTPRSRRCKRDALRALRGSILRTELYALDDSEREDRRPYTVTESAYNLKEFDAPTTSDAERLRIFFPHLIAQRTTQWERGDDPMTQFTFTKYLDENRKFDPFDPYGRPLQQTSVACPRGWRKMDDVSKGYLTTRTATVYASPLDLEKTYIVDRVARSTSFEIENSIARTVGQVRDLVATSSDLAIIGQTLSFYDRPAFVGLPFKQLEQFGALVRTETLVLTEKIITDAYGPERPPYLSVNGIVPANGEYPKEFRDNLPARAGYSYYPGDAVHAEGYFAQSERRQYDFHAASGPKRGLITGQRPPLGQAEERDTKIKFDDYDFLPSVVTDPAGLEMNAKYNYRVLQPEIVTDPNDNETAFTFSPLGLLESSFVRGKKTTEGDQKRPSVRMGYDFLAFANSPAKNHQPICVRTIRQTHHDTEKDVEQDETITTVEYSDGFGRLLQTRTQGEEVRFGDEHFGGGESVLPAKQTGGSGGDVVGRENTDKEMPNVVVSGWQTYDNKGQVVEKYEPFFSKGWNYGKPEDRKFGQKITMFYDPRGHTTRTLNPDGSEQRVIYGVPGKIGAPVLNQPDTFEPTPWEAYTYDANDLALLSYSTTEKLPDGSSKPLTDRAPVAHHFTPSNIVIDALGRTIESVECNAYGTNPIDEYHTSMSYDIHGNVLLIKDALKRHAFKHLYDLANRKLWLDSIDAGVRRTMFDAAGNVIEQRDSKGALILHAYDFLNRPIRLWARDGKDQNQTLRQKLEYGDGGVRSQLVSERSANKLANSLGRLSKQYDDAGLLTFDSYDFKGNSLEKTRRVISDAAILSVFDPPPPNWDVKPYRVNWDAAGDPLETKTYTSTMTYDALNRVKVLTYPEDVEKRRRRLVARYNRAGALEHIALGADTYVERIAYNAKGQRVLIGYGNGIMTRYAYDPQTLRLSRLRSEKFSKTLLVYHHAGKVLQDFEYQYDLAGNITAIHNRTPGSGIKDLPLGVDALDRTFTYNSLYYLRSATGRETDRPSDQLWDDSARSTDTAKARTYAETYQYDGVGNITELQHTGEPTRLFELVPKTDRLQKVTRGTTDFDYGYDGNGNITNETTSRHFEWDYADRMRVYRNQTNRSEPTVYANYLYDSTGARVKKLVRKPGAQVKVTVYVDGFFEYYRLTDGMTFYENNTLHIMDSQRRIAFVRVGTPCTKDITPAVKYQLADHLHSSNCVCDNFGNEINREEYSAYGETSFGSFALKRYRFTGKERDEESALSFHRARYYVPYLAKWTTCDPAGMVDGISLYLYARNNPMRFVDESGMESTNVDTPEERPSQVLNTAKLGGVVTRASSSEDKSISDTIVNDLSPVGSALLGAANTAWNWTKGAANTAWNWTKDAANTAWSWTKGAANTAWSWTKGAANTAWSWTKSAARTAWHWATTQDKPPAGYKKGDNPPKSTLAKAAGLFIAAIALSVLTLSPAPGWLAASLIGTAALVIGGASLLYAEKAHPEMVKHRDHTPFDVWSIVHGGAGIVFGLFSVPFPLVAVFTVAWEYFEWKVPGLGESEQLENRTTDVAVAWAGWILFAGVSALAAGAPSRMPWGRPAEGALLR
jgi:RHS repeat-associated protein